MKKQRYHAAIMRTSWLIIFMSFVLSACAYPDPGETGRIPDVMLGKWRSYNNDSVWFVHDNGQIDIYSDKGQQNIGASAKYIILDVINDHSALLLAQHDTKEVSNSPSHENYYYLFEVEGVGGNHSSQKGETILKTRFCSAGAAGNLPPLSFDQHKEKAKHLFYDCRDCAINELYYSKNNQVY